MPPTPAPTPSRLRAQAVELRRVAVLLLTVALTLAALLVPREASAHAATAHRARITSATTASYARAMLGLLNQERRAHGRRPLTHGLAAARLGPPAQPARWPAPNVMSHQLPGRGVLRHADQPTPATTGVRPARTSAGTAT